ncbi:NAD-dependent epimerase/dehydratase family protein [Roseimaritima sediminicola]|uniref:NAD-dependent epimerase/dehydratase family protein n=1 Tax=Roseimaritima sediminicola TaxID=2662066 RepID=UPI0012984452|nr:NAD-dependent epimerase/dehydratase family protein [Roseimaritima sediminicola]
MSTAIVTGATGFIGTRLCERLLAEGWRVRATVRQSSRAEELRDRGVELVPCDLSQEGLSTAGLQDVEVVFHLAGLTTSADLARLRKVNRDGTRRLAESLRRASNPPRVLHVSSIAASGPGLRQQVRRGDEPPVPISNYGRSKLEGERAIAELAEHCPITIVRPGVVFGPGDKEGFRIAAPIAKTGIHFVPGWRTPALSVVYVEDLVTIMLRAAADGARLEASLPDALVGPGVYTAACDAHPTYAQWGRMIGTAMGRRARVMPIPPRPAKVAGWVAGKLGSGSLHLDKIREAQVPSWAYFDPQLASQLSFHFEATLEEQLEQTIRWYREQGWLKPNHGRAAASA